MEQQLKKIEILKMDKEHRKEMNEGYANILHWFFSFPTAEIGLNNLSAEVKMSKTIVSRIIDDLEQEDFVHKKVYGRTWNLKCNTMHKYNFTRKISFNLL